MVDSNSSSFMSQTNEPTQLTRTSVGKNHIVLPILASAKELIAARIADQEEANSEDNDEETILGDIPVATEEGEAEVEDDYDEEDDGDGYDEEDLEADTCHEYRLDGYRMTYPVFEILTERLPNGVNGYLVKYDFVDSQIYVRTHPSDTYERTSRALTVTIIRWQTDPNNPTAAGGHPFLSRRRR
jgi:hypothetical protein